MGENVPAVCQKGRILKHTESLRQILQKKKKDNNNKSMYCLQQPILAEVQVCC